MKIVENLDLTKFNSYGIKAICKKAFFPESENDLIELYKNEPNKRKIVLGGGYNIILSKDYYEEDFIILGSNFSKIEVDDVNISCEAGASTYNVSLAAYEAALTGFEIFYDIPSSIGGSIVMNAGASGVEIKDNLLKVRYLDLVDKEVKEIENIEMAFSYRNSFFQKNPDMIVLKAWFHLKKEAKDSIWAKMEEIKQIRWSKQPKEFPNAGSVFKRPQGHFVGPMIDSLGLKGFSIGGAKISEKHSGFIVNYSNAKGSDILSIIEVIKKKVKIKFGIDLEVEQRII